MDCEKCVELERRLQYFRLRLEECRSNEDCRKARLREIAATEHDIEQELVMHDVAAIATANKTSVLSFDGDYLRDRDGKRL